MKFGQCDAVRLDYHHIARNRRTNETTRKNRKTQRVLVGLGRENDNNDDKTTFSSNRSRKTR